MSVPTLVVSGWLGSGKTTLVAQLLRAAQAEGIRLAIISNEFGDTGIDRALLDAGQDGLVELDGGCVCCKLSDALDDTVLGVLDKARPDRLILETSGVALPGEILLHFWRPPLRDRVSDVTVAVVADALRAVALQDDETFLDQLQAADLVLLSKCDLVDDDAIAAAKDVLSRITGGQPILEARRGDVPADALFPPDPIRREPRPHDHDHDHDHHDHHARFETRTERLPDGLSEDALIAHVAAYGAVRAKGFARTADGVRVVQGVGPRVEVVEPMAPPPEHLIGTLVLIDLRGATP